MAQGELAYVLPTRNHVLFPGAVQTILVGRRGSVLALDAAEPLGRPMLIVAQRDETLDEPGVGNLFDVGTLADVLHVLPLPDGTRRVALRGLARANILKVLAQDGALLAEVQPILEESSTEVEDEASLRELREAFEEAMALGLVVPPEVGEQIAAVESVSHAVDQIAQHAPMTVDARQALLEALDPYDRLQHLLIFLRKETEVLRLQASLREKVEQEVNQSQREYFLREQLRAIQRELDEEGDETDVYRQRLQAAGLDAAQMEIAGRELSKLARTPSGSPESAVIRGYLDWLADLPWARTTPTTLEMKRARGILDRHHAGLDEVKERILDELALIRTAGTLPGRVLCFVGPPGVGKTSVARSIADALGRQYERVSLAGIRDEAEIRGHRRTYVGAMPGRILQAMRRAGTRNPVLVLDEVDKLGRESRGDAGHALLEVLDPEQRAEFSDHYIEIPFDLSEVLFILTANALSDLPPALFDRLEVITFPSYTEDEKVAIAQKHLVPRARATAGLSAAQFSLGSATLRRIIRHYTHEAGVRELARRLESLARKAARRVAEGEVPLGRITGSQLGALLGSARPGRHGEHLQGVGVAPGLVVSSAGGDVLPVEVSLTEPWGETPEIRMTGNVGEIMQESAWAAVTYVRARSASWFDAPEFRHDVHIHLSEGAIRKDGPSAGLALVAALASALRGQTIAAGSALTGEISLSGHVLPVGGVRDKLLAAEREGMRTVVIPRDNMDAVESLPKQVRSRLRVVPVRTIDEALRVVLPSPRRVPSTSSGRTSTS